MLANPLPCRGHSLSGPWGCESLVKSGDETSREEAPRAELTGCSPPPSHLGSVGTVSYKFCQKGSSPCWGLWAPGREPLPAATSLFPVMS